jgi:hypothetical protein
MKTRGEYGPGGRQTYIDVDDVTVCVRQLAYSLVGPEGLGQTEIGVSPSFSGRPADARSLAAALAMGIRLAETWDKHIGGQWVATKDSPSGFTVKGQ